MALTEKEIRVIVQLIEKLPSGEIVRSQSTFQPKGVPF